MANIANIVLADAQSTPVNHTFAPALTPQGEAVWEDRASGFYIGFNKLTMKVQRPGPGVVGTRNIKLMLKVETPKLENTTNSTISGIEPAPTVSYRPVAELTVTLPERCSLQDRKDLQKYVLQLMSNAFVTDLFEKYEVAY